jgi:tripartite-type tricarboxylate transporter receptor subunit TctC
MQRRDLLKLGLASLATAMPRLSFGQAAYPDRPIKMIVPFAPGGVVDVIGRFWTDAVKSSLGTVVIENQGGAGGVIGANNVAHAPPDGYTILLGNTSTQVLNPTIMAKPPYDPIKDFVTIDMIAISATAEIVNPTKVPAQNLKELIDYAKANPGKLSYGSAGAGTLTNLAGEMFKHLAGGLDIIHLPYKGANPGITDLISGQIPMMTPNITGQLIELHKSGKIRILAVNTPERLKALPDVPTAQETVPNMIAQLFNGLFAPAGTPMPIVDKISQATRAALAQPGFQAKLVESGFEPVLDSSPDKAQRFLVAEHDRFVPIIKAIDFKMG